MDFEEAKEYLRTAAGRGSRLGLERITELCRLLGDPQDSIKTIHVAGTNGKGSFGAMLSAVLDASGYKTGWFSSPALKDVTECFRIGGKTILPERFAEVMADVAEKAESMEDKPTEFEVLTAAAFELFRRENCDISIIECGMGGDTDSTNVIKSPVLSVITNVQKDHEAFLGGTVSEIAGHKAGIIKQGRPVLFGGDDPAALDVVSRAAFEKGAPMYRPDSEQLVSCNCFSEGISFQWKDGEEIQGFVCSLIGTYQRGNILNAMTAVEILRMEGFTIPCDRIAGALRCLKWPGRFELLRKDPKIFFDGAHNPDGIREVVNTMDAWCYRTKAVMVMGVMADKDYRLYGEMLADKAELVLTVKPDNPRSLPAEKLAEALGEAGISAVPCGSFDEAVKRAVSVSRATDLPVIALGSLYMYREFTEALDKYLPEPKEDLWS